MILMNRLLCIFGGKNMSFFSSLKVLMISLILLIPVGIAIAIDDQQELTDSITQLTPVSETMELEYGPIEMTSMRTETSKTYDNGDGSYKAVIDENNEQQKSHSRSRTVDSFITNGDNFICGFDNPASVPNVDSNVGTEPDLWLPLDNTPEFKQCRVLLKFDISASVPDNSEINSADIKLQYHLSYDVQGTSVVEAGENDPLTITANAITHDWIEGTGTAGTPTTDGATWKTYDGINNWGTQGGDFSTGISGTGTTPTSGYGETTISAKNIVQAWTSGSQTNNGIILRGTGGNDFMKFFRSDDYGTQSERPKLEIDYVTNKAPVVQNYVNKVEMDEDGADHWVSLNYHIFNDGIYKDPDTGDTLTFFVWTGNKWGGVQNGFTYDSDNLTATVEINDTLKISLKKNANGEDRITLNATDAEGAATEHIITVTIDPVNDSPRINDTTKWKYSSPEPSVSVGTLTCKEDQWCNFTVTAWDPVERNDESKFKYDVNSTSEYASFFEIEEATGIVSFMPENEDVGIYKLKIMVDDKGAVNNIAEYAFTIEVENKNDKPYFSEISTIQFSQDILANAITVTAPENAIEDKYFNFTLYAEDEDMELEDSAESLIVSVKPADRFTVSTIQHSPQKIVQVSFLPTNDDVGIFTAQLSVTDRDNSDTTIELLINVFNINDVPMFSTFYYGTQIIELEESEIQVLDLEDLGKVYKANERQYYNFSLKAIDIDLGDDLEFDVEIQNYTKSEQKEVLTVDDGDDIPNPDLVTLTKQLMIYIDTRAGRAGELWLNVTVEDRSKAEGLLILRIPVENINDKPPESKIDVTIRDAHPKTRLIPENLTVKFVAREVNDPDGDDLNYTWDFDDTDGLTIDDRGEEVFWTYPTDGTYTVTLTVDDGNGGTSVVKHTVEVVKPPKIKKDDGGGLALDASVGGVNILYIIIIIIVVIVILISVFMIVRRKKKREAEEAAAAAAAEEEARQQQLLQAQYQYAQMAQYQAYQQQLMQQYPEQYQQMMAQQQMGYDQTQQQQMQPQQQQMQPQQYGAQEQSQYGTAEQLQYSQPDQTIPQQSEELAMGQPAQAGLPAPGVAETPQLPPASEDTVPAAEEEPEMPVSPYADVQTQTLEEELGVDAAVAEVPIEPDTSAPEPEVAPEPEAAETPEEPQPETEPTPETKAEGEEKPEEGGKACANCGAAVKEGWFLCPECKKPLI
jgi:hypothetical protein